MTVEHADGTTETAFCPPYSAKIDYAGNCGIAPDIMVGSAQTGEYGGLFYCRSSLPESEIVDGLSNTCLIGEKYLRMEIILYDSRDAGDDDPYSSGCNHDNLRCYGIGRIMMCRLGYGQIDIFGSTHTGGMNMSFCDGHVSRMSYNINAETLSNLLNCKDGNIVESVPGMDN